MRRRPRPRSSAMAVVEIAGGRLRGRRAGEAFAFEGIPYATAPRFAPPGPTPGRAGVRAAAAPGPAAPQPRRPAAVFTHGELPGTDEECLSLNVFSPALDSCRPVFVWLHGGGFAIGHAGASLYSGERLARAAGAVVVTVNYRLGSLGWLASPIWPPGRTRRLRTGACSTRSPRSNGCATTSLRSAATPLRSRSPASRPARSARWTCSSPRRRPGCSGAPSCSRRR